MPYPFLPNDTSDISPSVSPDREPMAFPCAVLCLAGQSCLTLCDPMDCNLPGSSIHGDSPGKNTGVRCRTHSISQQSRNQEC